MILFVGTPRVQQSAEVQSALAKVQRACSSPVWLNDANSEQAFAQCVQRILNQVSDALAEACLSLADTSLV